MMHLERRTFVAIVILALVGGAGVGALATGRAAEGTRTRTLAAPLVDAPILPVQMPLQTGTFAKVAELIKPAVVNINTVFKGGAGSGPGRATGRRCRSLPTASTTTRRRARRD